MSETEMLVGIVDALETGTIEGERLRVSKGLELGCKLDCILNRSWLGEPNGLELGCILNGSPLGESKGLELGCILCGSRLARGLKLGCILNGSRLGASKGLELGCKLDCILNGSWLEAPVGSLPDMGAMLVVLDGALLLGALLGSKEGL